MMAARRILSSGPASLRWRLLVCSTTKNAINLRPGIIRYSSGGSSSSATSTTTVDYDAPAFDDMEITPPAELTVDMVEGISDATRFYIRHGVSNRRLKSYAKDDAMPLVVKWQKMMEVFLTTQVHVIAGLGYATSEEGLTQYARDLGACIEKSDDTMRALFAEVRQDTWRDMVSTCFELDKEQIPVLSIVDARNLMHKVSSKMIEPDILLEVQSRTAKIDDKDPETKLAMKHRALQEVLVNQVYLGGNPSIVEEGGFGSGAKGYATMQCAMSDYEGDPLIAQYAAAAMAKLWDAAGFGVEDIQKAAATPSTAKLLK